MTYIQRIPCFLQHSCCAGKWPCPVGFRSMIFPVYRINQMVWPVYQNVWYFLLCWKVAVSSSIGIMIFSAAEVEWCVRRDRKYKISFGNILTWCGRQLNDRPHILPREMQLFFPV